MVIDIVSIILEVAFIISYAVLNCIILRRLDKLEDKVYDIDDSLFGKDIK